MIDSWFEKIYLRQALRLTPFLQDLTAQIEDLKGKIATIVRSLADSVVANAKLDEVSVGLAISIDGDIGIVSAGAEASIELKFKVEKPGTP